MSLAAPVLLEVGQVRRVTDAFDALAYSPRDMGYWSKRFDVGEKIVIKSFEALRQYVIFVDVCGDEYVTEHIVMANCSQMVWRNT